MKWQGAGEDCIMRSFITCTLHYISCGTHGRYKKFIQYLVQKPEDKTPLGRPRRRWKYNIRMDLRKIEYGGVDWIIAQYKRPVAGSCQSSNELPGSIKGGNFLTE
jgi:hypothetical protein